MGLTLGDLEKGQHFVAEYVTAGKPTNLATRCDCVTSEADPSAVVTRAAPMYANDSHGKPREPVGELRPGQVIRTRYDHGEAFVMVRVAKGKDDANAKGVFVRRDDLRLEERPSRQKSRMTLP